MNKYLINFILPITGILLVIAAGFIFFTEFSNRSPLDKTTAAPIPIAAIYLDGSTLHFNCLDDSSCFHDLDLGSEIKQANDPLQHPLRIGFAYYDNNSTFYALLSGSTGQYLAKVNLEKSQVQILDPSSFIGGLGPGMASIVQGKLILSTANGKISVVQNDFSIKTIADLKSHILDFIETKDSKIAAISTNGLLQNGSKQIKVFLVNTDSGIVEEKILSVPLEGEWFFIAVDQDIRHLYLEPVGNSITLTYTNILDVFDLQTQKITLSIPISNSDALTYSTQTAKQYQYHGIWYYSRRCPCEGPAPAMLINMSTLKPVINPEDFLKNEADATFIISPFGDNFLIGTHSRVFLITPDGNIIKTYNLPSDWVGRDYLLLEYRN